MKSADPRVQRIIECFESLTETDVPRLAEIYSADATFKDPFNEVQGSAAICRVFGHMFVTVQVPRFVIREAVVQGEQCFLTWDFSFRRARDELVVRGASHLRLAGDGRIAMHRDYWDAAEELYEKLPVLGILMRALRRRLTARIG